LEISIQINGKAKDTLMVSADVSPAALEKAALSAEKVVPFLQGKVIRRVVVVPQKLVNIAVE
jgi:leucyl-tRNA synthetase